MWAPLLNQRFNRRGRTSSRTARSTGTTFAPDAYRPAIEESSAPDAWHPEDALFVPLRHSDGHLLGVLAVDEPASGRMPTDEDLDVLVVLGAHAALALEGAQEEADLARHRAQLEQLLQVSAQLTESVSIESTLDSVCDGIAAALGFQNASIDLADPASGGLQSAGVARMGAGRAVGELGPPPDRHPADDRARAARSRAASWYLAEARRRLHEGHRPTVGDERLAARGPGTTTGCSCRSTPQGRAERRDLGGRPRATG